jgi:hypothetical protein
MFYSASAKSFSPSVIWDDSRPISNALYNEVSEQLARGRVLMSDPNGDPYTVAPVIIEVVYTLEEIYEMQLEKLSNDYELMSSFLRSGYPKSECDTWTLQIEEANRYTDWVSKGSIGPRPPSQFLSALWAGRKLGGMVETLDELIGKVIRNNNVYTPVLALITSYRHVTLLALYAAKMTDSKTVLSNVKWDFMTAVNAATNS